MLSLLKVPGLLGPGAFYFVGIMGTSIRLITLPGLAIEDHKHSFQMQVSFGYRVNRQREDRPVGNHGFIEKLEPDTVLGRASQGQRWIIK